MKRLQLAVLAISLTGILAAGNVLAADTATINVSATVLGTCLFQTANYDMDFGEIDPGGTGDVTAPVTLQFTCSNGTTWTLDDESGAKSMTGTVTAGNLAYSIDTYTLSGTGTGAAETVDVTGRIVDTAYGAAAADVYTDSFTININP